MKNSAIDEFERVILARRFNTEEMGRLEKLFAPFCKTGQICLSHLVLAGKMENTIDEILEACNVQWEAVWKNGTEGRIGDTDDAAPGVGLRNACAFFATYKALGVPEPRTL